MGLKNRNLEFAPENARKNATPTRGPTRTEKEAPARRPNRTENTTPKTGAEDRKRTVRPGRAPTADPKLESEPKETGGTGRVRRPPAKGRGAGTSNQGGQK